MASEYVAAYQAQLTSVIADERYLQSIDRQVPRVPGMPRSRQLNSEVFFMFEPAGTNWLAIRDVVRVDGQVVTDRPVLADLLQQLPPSQVLQTFKAFNARYNLGRIGRNFNEPTLALALLTASHRSRFRFAIERIEGGGRRARLTFREVEGPALVRDPVFGDALTTGALTVDVGTGRVERTFLAGAAGPGQFELETVYVDDAKLGLWVPSRFRERYRAGIEPRSIEGDSEFEDISGEARYSNYRRFATSGRIKR